MNQISRGGAVAFGLLFVAAGIMPILMSSGVIPTTAEPNSPPWVGFCAGLLFVVGGVTVILDYAVADGVGPDGDLKPGTPFSIRIANLLLGLTIVGLMIAIFGWVAFGPGPRTFSTTISLPFMTRHSESSGLSGCIAFGFGTVMMVLMWVVCAVVGIRRLLRARATP